MKQDRGTSRGPSAAQVLLNVLAAVALVAFGSVISMSAASAEADSEETAAAWPARWTAYTQVDGTPIRDVDGDVTPSSVDLVSGACETCTGPTGSVAWASDGSNAFFRIRLGTDLKDSPEGGPLDEAYVVQIADGSGAVRAAVGVHRTGAQQTVYVSDAVGDVVMQAHTSPLVAAEREPLGVRVVPADDGSGRFFLDFQVPLSLIETASGGAVTAATPIRLYYGSSATANLTTKDLATITGDFMLGNVRAVDFSTLATVTLAAPQHQVTFDSAGGTDTALQTVAEGFAAAPPVDPTRTGHTFTGWFPSTADGPAYDFEAAVVGATTIHAHWSRDSYLVTFDSAGGSAVADQTVPYGDEVAPVADPTREDDAFLGWFSASTGGTPFVAGALPVTERTSLYAHWRVSSPSDVDAPAVEPTPPAPGAPAATPAQPGPPSQPGTADVGGSMDDVTAPVADDLSTSHARSSRTTHPAVIVPKGDSAVDSTAPVADGSSIPHARSSRTTHPVVFYPNGGTAVDSQTVATGDTASVPSVPARPGYAFAGWFAEAVGDEEWDFSVPIDEATTLYAHWTADAGGTPEEPGDDAITPDADTDCADYATSADATAAMGPGDPDRLDADSDGTACEGSLPAGDSDDTSDDAGQEGEDGAGEVLPDTGNQVPQALVPAAGLLLLLGFVLMTWDRRRAEGAPGPA